MKLRVGFIFLLSGSFLFCSRNNSLSTQFRKDQAELFRGAKESAPKMVESSDLTDVDLSYLPVGSDYNNKTFQQPTSSVKTPPIDLSKVDFTGIGNKPKNEPQRLNSKSEEKSKPSAWCCTSEEESYSHKRRRSIDCDCDCECGDDDGLCDD